MLAKIFGVFGLVATVAAFVNRKHMIRGFKELMKHEGLLLTVAGLELLIATYVLNIHNVWEGWPMVLTIVFWLAFIEGAFYLFFPDAIKKFRRLLKKESYYYFACVLMLVLSIFFVYQGYFA